MDRNLDHSRNPCANPNPLMSRTRPQRQVRTFSTPASGLLARTYEAEHRIVRIELIQLGVPYINEINNVIRTLSGDDIPAIDTSAAKAKLTYDVVAEKP